MPIIGIYWTDNTRRDIHVLRGQSTPDLTHQSLKFRLDTDPTHDLFADQYIGQFHDVTLKFTPLFKGNQQGDIFVGDNNGIRFNTSTGSASLDLGAPLNRKNNFIVEVEAKNNVGGNIFNETIRIQIHGSVSQVWLTPDRLTVRRIGPPGAIVHTAYRFAVRAQFDDNVVGDLTVGHGVTWNESAGHVDQNGKITILAGDNPGDNFFVSATLPAQFGGASTPLGPTLHIDRSWSDESAPPKFTIVAGGGVPATGTAENTANVLMLGDGFRAGDEDSFNQIVDTFVHFLRTNELTKPFNLFTPKMNFWKAYFPANGMGISFRSEMFIIGISSYAQPIPAVKKPTPDPSPQAPTQWNLQNLLYKVGLPVPGDEVAARTPNLLKEEWRKLLPEDPVPHLTADLNDSIVKAWKILSRRTFIEEQDCFPGLSYGNVPAANTDDTTWLHLHEDRANLQLLRAVCGTLKSDDATLGDGRPIGVLWAGDEAGFRYLNSDLVVLISSTPAGRAANWSSPNFGRYMAVTTGRSNPYIPVTPVAGKNSFVLDMAAVPTDIEASGSRIVAHELGHSLCLGDEYPEFSTPFPMQSADARQVNLQTEHDAHDPVTGSLSGDQISWRWHRIVAAAVVDQGVITAAGPNRFRIPVIPDVSFRFAQGQTVLLRQRRWKVPLHKLVANDVSPALLVAAPPESDAIVVSPGQGVQITLADLQAFLPGSLLYTPKPAPASVRSAAYPFAEMVAKNVKDAITANKKPLTQTVVPCLFDIRTQIPLVDDEEGRTPIADFQADFADIVRTVGLYAGGARYPCGIFHPAGQCMMRNEKDAQAEFCAVCRYIMVDLIAPEFHSDIDLDYDRIYPQR
jgi:hypothetical protein